jgi:transcriptional regulator of acetoin/glycerol metabolism
MNCLFQYDWPGNVRELENCIERALALGNHKLIDVLDLPASMRATGTAISLPAPELVPVPGSATDLEQIERETILRVFQQVGGDKVQAGKMLGISRATLYRKLKRYNIEPRSPHAAAVPVGAPAILRAE